jgi:hypothetical protein
MTRSVTKCPALSPEWATEFASGNKKAFPLIVICRPEQTTSAFQPAEHHNVFFIDFHGPLVPGINPQLRRLYVLLCKFSPSQDGFYGYVAVVSFLLFMLE